jgi:transketolase
VTAVGRGGYVLVDTPDTPDVVLIGTGSEVAVCVEAARALGHEDIAARVVSMPSVERFLAQDDAYRASVLPPAVRARVAVEAGATQSWHRFVGLDGAVVGLDHFGASAPAERLFEEFGFTAENVVAVARRVVGR